MGILIVGIVLFVGTHLLTTRRAMRARLIGRLGANGYKGLYSMLAMAGFVLLIVGFGRYREAGFIEIWAPPRWLTHVSFALLLPVFPLLIAAKRACWITATTRHPMMLAVKLWALAHLLVNGDLGSILLFGSLLLWAGYARGTMRDRESAEGAAPAPAAPFGKVDVMALAGGLALYAVFAKYLHPLLIGVPVVGV
ncbi:MAG: NnrU family protein [Rhodospirillales bacterium]|nr:NnrU family protein [Rhodospirillales bacterium]